MKYNYVGNCVNSFDEDGNCIVFDLPWRDVTEFAQQEEKANVMTPQTVKLFLFQVDFNKELLNMIKNHNVEYSLSEDNTFIIYDLDDDIHYFFRK